MQLDDYLTPRADSGPSGANLEYDPVFIAMTLAARPGEERQAGSDILAAEEPNYAEASKKALAVLERSHDLRAGAVLAMTQLKLEGLEGFADATHYLRNCLTEYWETCHPELDADDDNDPTMRVTAILALAEPETILRTLRLTPLAESPNFGRLNLRDLAIADGEIAAPADATDLPDANRIAATFRDTLPELLRQRRDAARRALDNVLAINRVFDERTPGEGPNLEPLTRLLRKAVVRLSAEIGEDAAPAAESEASAEPVADTPTAASPSGAGGTGTISSAADVSDAIDRIIAYYARYEPSSPVPLILARARRLVGADFLAVVRDLAPQGLDSFLTICGIDGSA